MLTSFTFKATTMIVLEAVLLLVRGIMLVYDFISFPIYFIFQKSFKDTRGEALGRPRMLLMKGELEVVIEGPRVADKEGL